jgi:hypothetical protein
MRNVVFEEEALDGINQYIEWYTDYFEELYSDAGLW